MRRFLAWLVRPQFNALAIAAAFVVGNSAYFHLAWWLVTAVAASIGVTYGLLTVLIEHLLHRRAHG